MAAVSVLTSDFVFDGPFEVGFLVGLDRGVDWSHASFMVTAVMTGVVVIVATHADCFNCLANGVVRPRYPFIISLKAGSYVNLRS